MDERWLLTLLTHALSALLGGGLATGISSLLKARTGRGKLTLKQYAALNKALQRSCEALRAENRKYEQTIWELRQGMIDLHYQIQALGEEPCYQPREGLPEGENHNGHE